MTLVLFGLFFLFLLAGVPVAVTIGASTAVALYVEDVPLMLAAQRMFAGIDSFALIAVPFFILAGDLIA